MLRVLAHPDSDVVRSIATTAKNQRLTAATGLARTDGAARGRLQARAADSVAPCQLRPSVRRAG